MTQSSVCDNPWEVAKPSEGLPASRCWFAVQGDVDRIEMAGMRTALPESGQLPDGLHRFELPAPISRHGETSELQEFRVFIKGTEKPFELQHSPRRVDMMPVPYRDNDELDVATLSPQERMFVDAQSVVARHASLINEVCTAVTDAFGVTTEGVISPFKPFAETWIKTAREDDARHALIVTIAKDLVPLFLSICKSPRRILRRERRQEDLDRVQQVDPACLRWLSRQPGRDVVEKSGPRQQILAVVRVEHADTLENRVIRDFALRSIRAAKRYAIENRRFPQSERYKSVNQLRRTLVRLLRETDIGRASALVAMPEPNYVLMFDPRYSRMWPLYLRLRREEQEIDDLWRWRHRTWAEIVMSLILVALDELTEYALEGSRLTRGFVHLSSEQQFGQFIRLSSECPAFYCGSAESWICRPVLSCQSNLQDSRLCKLWSLGPDFILWCIRPYSPTSEAVLIGVWTEFSVLSSIEHIQEQAQSLEARIKASALANVCGVFAVPSHRGEDGEFTTREIEYASQHSFPTIGVRLPVDQFLAKNVMIRVVEKVLGVLP